MSEAVKFCHQCTHFERGSHYCLRPINTVPNIVTGKLKELVRPADWERAKDWRGFEWLGQTRHCGPNAHFYERGPRLDYPSPTPEEQGI